MNRSNRWRELISRFLGLLCLSWFSSNQNVYQLKPKCTKLAFKAFYGKVLLDLIGYVIRQIHMQNARYENDTFFRCSAKVVATNTLNIRLKTTNSYRKIESSYMLVIVSGSYVEWNIFRRRNVCMDIKNAAWKADNFFYGNKKPISLCTMFIAH